MEPGSRRGSVGLQVSPCHSPMLAAPDTASGTEAAARLTEWARHRSTSARGRRQRRQATILARDVLALLGGVRSCCLLDAEHGPYASDADALCDFLRGGEHSSGTVRTLPALLSAVVNWPGHWPPH